MNATTEQKTILEHDEIAALAQQIWQTEGCKPGRDRENWLKAERQLLATRPKNGSRANVAVAKRKSSSVSARRSVTL